MPPPSHRAPSIGQQLFLAAFLVAATVAVYWPALRGDFLWDDYDLLINNPLIARSDGLYRFWFTTEPRDYFPLTSTMFWLEWRLWGRDPTGYHVVNVLLHALSAALLWQVLKRLSAPGAWLAALLFAVHPVAVASAAWITEGKNTLPMVFFLLSILAYLRHESRPTGVRWYALSLALFLLALLAKTSVVVLPLVLLLVAWWQRGAISRTDFRRTLPFFALSLAFGLVTVWFQSHNAIQGEEVRPEGWASRLAATGWIAGFYLYKLLWPVDLCATYPRWTVNPAQPLHWLPLLALTGILTLFWTYRKGWGRGPLLGLGYFVLALLPVLGFIDMAFFSISLVADHLQYLAMPGILALAAAGITRALDAGGWRRALAMGVAVAVVAGMVGLARMRAALYHNPESFWRDTLARNPSSWMAWSNLGETYAAQRRYDEALDCFNRAIAAKPTHAGAFCNRGYVRAHREQFALAIQDYDRAIELQPRYAVAYNNRGVAHARLGQREEAIRDYTRAVECMPIYTRAWYNRGKAYAEGNRLQEALRDYTTALELNPDFAPAWHSRAVVHAQLGQYERALADLRAYQRLGGKADPRFLGALTHSLTARAP